jgi:hypothetical protein
LIDSIQFTTRSIDSIVHQFADMKNERDLLQDELRIAREGLLSTANNLSKMLEVTGKSYNDLDLQGLVLQVDLLLEELETPGKNPHFISVFVLNDMTAKMRGVCKLDNAKNPVLYFPVLSKKMVSLMAALAMVSAVANALESFFNQCNFTPESFDPSKPTFAILRELMFRMHAIFGKHTQTHAHRKIVTVMERMISLASSLFSYLASAGFQSLKKSKH